MDARLWRGTKRALIVLLIVLVLLFIVGYILFGAGEEVSP
jgi:hypothetical protein